MNTNSILYFTAIDIENKANSGVIKKIGSQCRVFERQFGRNNVFISAFNGDEYLVWKSHNFPSVHSKLIMEGCKRPKKIELASIYRHLYSYIVNNEIGYIYYRCPGLTPACRKFFSNIVDLGGIVVMEIPTWPFWKELFGRAASAMKGSPIKGLLGICSQLIYWVEAHRIKGLVKGIVTYSIIDMIWGIPAVGISNGYNFDSIAPVERKMHDSINLVVSATLRDNHGIDRIIKSVAEYDGEERICLHIAGEGDASLQLYNLADSLGVLNSRVVFHGYLTSDELHELYSISDIGVSALGFYRYGVRVYSPLKSKEYFAVGLPCIGTTGEVDIINSDVAKFYYAVPNDDTPIDMCEIVKFVNELRNGEVSPVIIRQEAKRVFDWNVVMRPVIKLFYNIQNKGV